MGIQARLDLLKKMQAQDHIDAELVQKVLASGDELNNALIDFLTLKANSPDTPEDLHLELIHHAYSVCTRNMDRRAAAYAYYLKEEYRKAGNMKEMREWEQAMEGWNTMNAGRAHP